MPVSPQDHEPNNPYVTPDWYKTGGNETENFHFIAEVTFANLPRDLVRIHARCRHDGLYWFLAYADADVAPDLAVVAERVFECEVCGDAFTMHDALSR